jgi:hypothetical protein
MLVYQRVFFASVRIRLLDAFGLLEMASVGSIPVIPSHHDDFRDCARPPPCVRCKAMDWLVILVEVVWCRGG